MSKVWVNKADSFSEAEDFDKEYYLKMPPSQKLEIIQQLREEYFRVNKIGEPDESGKRLRRVLAIIEQ